MSIPTTVFIEHMAHRWESFGNIVSPPLCHSWGQICSTLNDKLRAAVDPNEDEVWKVLCPPTGSGKTQGLIVYASLLSQETTSAHPGMLIVTRLIADADDIASQINELSKEYADNPGQQDMAISYHSLKKGMVTMSDLASYPVLVICHKAYTLALDVLDRNAGIEDTWDYFNNFLGGRRKLVVIDEAIDLVEYSEITLQSIRNLTHFSEPIKGLFPFQWELLSCLKGIFEEIDKQTDQTHHEMIINDKPVREWPVMVANNLLDVCKNVDFTGFKKALRSVRMDEMNYKHDPEENRRLLNRCNDTVSSVDSLFKTFLFYSRNQSVPTFNTARLLVPPSVKGGVILDATASCNIVYDLFDGAQIIQPPPRTRQYTNANLHVSYGHAVGKTDMKTAGLALSQSLIAELDAWFEPERGRKVLIVTHKAIEPFLTQYIPDNFTMSVAHWGAVDGSNHWQDHDTVVIFGLPYRPKRWAPSTFMAWQGVKDTAWLHDTEQRKFKHHEDIRKAINISQMTTDILQAVNRVQCRRVIDEDGNCPKTDVFILLPTLADAATLLKGITAEMPGISTVEWNYRHQKQGKRGRKVHRGNFDKSLIAYLRGLNQGDRQAASKVKKTLCIKETSWERIAKRLTDKLATDPMCMALQEMCVSYRIENRRAYFIKSEVLKVTPVYSH